MARASHNGGGANAASVPTGHSRFGASSSDRFLNCPGSVGASAGLPNESSSYAMEGTAGHTVASLCLENNQDAIEFVDRDIDVDGTPIPFTEELAEAVQVYVDAIRDDKAKRGGKLLIERRFHLPWLHPDFYGTSDCGRLGEDSILSVYDMKLGRGKTVEVALRAEVDGHMKVIWINPQLAYYGLGMIETMPRTLPIKRIELVIVQPRKAHKDGPVRRITVDHSDLLDAAQDLVDAAKAADGPDPTFKAGEWCTFCLAKPTCKHLRSLALTTAQVDFDDDVIPSFGHNSKPVEPKTLDNDALGKLLGVTDLIESWLHSVRAHAETILNAGGTIPGFKLVDKRASRKWNDETTLADELSLVFGLDDSAIYGKKLLSPAQVEKLLPKAERPSLASLYTKASSGKTLAALSDARTERKPDAQTDFDD